MERSTSNGRARFLALLALVPSLVAGTGLLAVETYRLVSPDAALFAAPPAASFLEAVRRGNQGMEEAYRFVDAGLDPNGPISIEDEDLTGGQTITTTPLMLAVAAGNRNVVLMLLNFGAKLDVDQNRAALCLAQVVGNAQIVEALARNAPADAGERCPAGLADAEFPLAAALGRSGR